MKHSEHGTAAVEALRRIALADGARLTWNPHEPVDRLVAARAAATPDAIAVIDREVETSYRSLMERAAHLAEVLNDRGVIRGARIGVCAAASIELFSAILAIWAVGATYVPLDPVFPSSRLELIIDDAAVSLLLVDRAGEGRVGASTAVIIDGLNSSAREPFSSDARLNDAAYIVYTSGSTGLPKGVEIEHAGLTNAILASNQLLSFEARDRQLYRTSIAFDVSLYEIFGPLVAGATVVVAPRGSWADPRACLELVTAFSITAISVSSSFLATLLDEPTFKSCTSLRLVTSGTDAMSLGLCRRFFASSDAILYNGYGPSEATIVVTAHRCSPADADSGEETAPLGHALANSHVSVRDVDLIPVSPGSTGEIVISGVQVAKGYINRPEETAARFVSDPLRPHERLYRTGDLARLVDSDTVVFLGRNDKQVKIRGHRVEPAEVAAAIERLDGVRTAVVLARRRQPTEETIDLVAYVAGRSGVLLDITTLRRALRTQLPAAMVPAKIVLVDALPLTITGKIDEVALAKSESLSTGHILNAAGRVNEGSFRGILHEQLRAVWEALLKLERVGDDDDFYDLGGDSLLAVRMMACLEDTFGQRVAFADFFDAMTITGLAKLLLAGTESRERDAVRFNEDGLLPPLVFLHGDFAGGMYAWSLARMLGPNQPLLVIPPHGMRGRPPATDVESMAADTMAVIARFYPNGPLRVGGYSSAGLVAYETARRLVGAGRDILDVVIIGIGAENVAFAALDVVIRGLRLPRTWRNAIILHAMRASFRIARFVHMPGRKRWLRLRYGLRASSAIRVTLDEREAIEMGNDYQRYVLAHETYIPPPYDGRLTILWPRDQSVENGNVQRDWLHVAPHVEIVYVPGSHHEAVSRYLGEIVLAMQQRFLA